MVQIPDTLWLDQVLAVPTIGILIAPNFELSVTYAARAAGFLAGLHREGAVAVAAKNPYEVRVQTATGLQFVFSSDNLIFSFRYPSPVEDRAGDLPIQREPETRPYSALLKTVLGKAGDALRALMGADSVSVLRVGVVAESWIAAAAPPPGVADLVDHIGKPWGQRLQKVSATLLARLQASDRVIDRCHHRIEYDDGDKVDELKVGLDWQRLFDGGRTVRAKDLVSVVGECESSALRYFQALGDGTGLGGA